MTWTAEDRKQIARVLLGSWPSQVPGWGREALATYLELLEARGLTAESVLLALYSWPTGDFAPSVPTLARAARRAAFRELGRTGRLEVLPADARTPGRDAVHAIVNRELGRGT